jgi:membrane protein required for colicin V production
MSSGLNMLDIVFFIVVSLSILFGVLRGFIRELFSVVFLIIAVVLSFLFYRDAGHLFMKCIDNRDISNFAGFLSIFVIVLIIGSLVTYCMKKILIHGPLKSVDRILGGVFGLVRGILISGIIVFALIAFSIDNNLLLKSKIAPYLKSSIEIFLKLLPDNVRDKFNLFYKGTNNHDRQKNTRTSRTV